MIVKDPTKEVDISKFVEWCCERMPHYQIPRYIEFKEKFQKTAIQRINKVVLKEEGVTKNTIDAWDYDHPETRKK